MQFGVPVAAANTKVFNEVYDDGAIYFDPHNPKDMANQLHLLAGDVAFHKLRQKKATERAALFDWHNAAKQTLALYNSLTHDQI
jgi:glycosyltransferase involved in cell wall biosynthesis